MPTRRPTAIASRIAIGDHAIDDLLKTSSGAWEQAAPCQIRCWHENSGAHRPETTARLLWDDYALYVKFDVQDRREQLVARHTEPNAPTYRDSCVELFIGSSKAGSSAYMNVEISCLGTILLQTHMQPRQGGDADPRLWNAQIKRWASVKKSELCESDPPGPFAWSVAVRVPFALVDELLERPATAAQGELVPPGEPFRVERSGWRIGLFKCADDAPAPHWAAWAPIGERLDFHQPDTFGKLHLARGQPSRSAKKRERPS